MLKMIVQTLAFIVFPGLLLFVLAGHLAWPQAWIFLALFEGYSLAFGVWLRRTDPHFLAERMKSPFSAGQKLWDRIVMGTILIGFAVWVVSMALDVQRFHWSYMPPWTEGLGAVLVMAHADG